MGLDQSAIPLLTTPRDEDEKGTARMITIGIILAIVGAVIPSLRILVTIGLVLIVVGVVLLLLGAGTY